jgi:hypothetical protein
VVNFECRIVDCIGNYLVCLKASITEKYFLTSFFFYADCRGSQTQHARCPLRRPKPGSQQQGEVLINLLIVIVKQQRSYLKDVKYCQIM